VAQKDDKIYAKCWAEFTAKEPVRVEASESQEQLKKKEAVLLARDAAKAFTAAHSGWVYEFAKWQGENLTKKFADLVEDEKPAAKPSEPNSPQPAEKK